MYSKTELAWAAGFFDGEGCCLFNGAHKLTAEVAQVDRYVLDRFNAAVGNLGMVKGPYKNTNPKARHYYQWTVSNHVSVQQLVACLWSYLSPVKQKQFRQAIKEYLQYIKTKPQPKWKQCQAAGHRIRVSGRNSHSCADFHIKNHKIGVALSEL